MQCGERERFGKDFARPAHDPRARIETDRNIRADGARGRTQPRVTRRDIVEPCQQPQRRRGIG